MADERSIREGHDRIAKRLFAHAEVVADLLRNFVPEGMLPDFDAGTLRRYPEERVDSGLALRRADVAWEFEVPGGGRVVVLIEAQSTPDVAMASRMLVQCGMVWEACQRGGRGRVPGMLPVVFYTGQAHWRATQGLSEVAGCPRGLLSFMPGRCYLLLDARRMASSQLPERCRMSLMIRMAAAEGSAEAHEALRLAWTELDEEEEDAEFCRDLWVWAARVLWPSMFEGKEIDQDENLREVLKMFMDAFPEEKEELLAKGRRQGIEQGMERGMERGIKQATRELRAEERRRLARQATRKFGRRAGMRIDAYLSKHQEADDLERALGWFVDCRSEEEILAKLPGNGTTR